MADALELSSHSRVRYDDLIESVSEFPVDSRPVARQAHRKVPSAYGLQRVQQLTYDVVFRELG